MRQCTLPRVITGRRLGIISTRCIIGEFSCSSASLAPTLSDPLSLPMPAIVFFFSPRFAFAVLSWQAAVRSYVLSPRLNCSAASVCEHISRSSTVLLLSSLYDGNPSVIFLPNVPAMRSDVGGGVGATRQMDVMTATAPRAGGALASFSNPAR